jgi:hypothetical protein
LEKGGKVRQVARDVARRVGVGDVLREDRRALLAISHPGVGEGQQAVAEQVRWVCHGRILPEGCF